MLQLTWLCNLVASASCIPSELNTLARFTRYCRSQTQQISLQPSRALAFSAPSPRGVTIGVRGSSHAARGISARPGSARQDASQARCQDGKEAEKEAAKKEAERKMSVRWAERQAIVVQLRLVVSVWPVLVVLVWPRIRWNPFFWDQSDQSRPPNCIVRGF